MLIRSRRKQTNRRGVATVELAVCLPVLVLLVFGAIEASSFIFLKQSLNVAAYEGVREAVRVGSSNGNGQNRAENILNARSVNDFNVAFLNGDVSAIDRGEDVVIEVSAPTNSNSPLVGQFIPNRTLTARVVMVKE
ncbi:TadE-like protein [Rubripirellula amarantea]|uniref:TadE-like protein n=1 Tax=Rubripirellula amarantea TaxID=2527999 RepID=A0A5C5WYS0_9BACT|nr:TadE/TadG family type IV pilus assembly protein [Rubripirellula amarantea]TWT55143.1 TadE-like protein [Rubripirellula amarantea]